MAWSLRLNIVCLLLAHGCSLGATCPGSALRLREALVLCHLPLVAAYTAGNIQGVTEATAVETDQLNRVQASRDDENFEDENFDSFGDDMQRVVADMRRKLSVGLQRSAGEAAAQDVKYRKKVRVLQHELLMLQQGATELHDEIPKHHLRKIRTIQSMVHEGRLKDFPKYSLKSHEE